MAKIPLNYFRRVGYSLPDHSQTVYTTPYGRAGIILTALATNVTPNIQTVTLSLSAAVAENGTTVLDIVKEVKIGAYDVANLTIGKVVLTEGDSIIASCSAPSAVNINFSILEAVNTK